MAADILDKAKEHYKTAKDGWQEIYRKARDDLAFLSDAPYAQWDQQEAMNRTSVGRPTVEIDQLSQFVHQVSNDIRQNTPTIHVIPAGDGADVETAEVISGRIKAIEYKSNADAAYDMAADFSIKSSIGYLRVDHRYINDSSFDQELYIQRVINPSAIMIDPASIQADGSDAKFGFVFEEMDVGDFKKKWPKATPVSFGEEKPSKAPSDHDKITIVEYFVLEDSFSDMGLKDDGSMEPVKKNGTYKSKRSINTPKILRYKLSGENELEKTSFPGRYIPLVPVYGEEAWIEGKRNLYSLIRKSKSAQMMYNQLKSSETEILMKQQQAPVMAAVGQMRNFEDDWKKPDKAMVLYYHQTDAAGQQCTPPQRLVPPEVSAGFANASLDAENNIRKTMGMYNAGVGKREGEASGVALKQLERSGDTASLHFGDNLVRSITHVGKIIVCALPEIEDTPRMVQTIGKEDEMKTIGINGMRADGQDEDYHFDQGEWDVRVVTGAPFTTQRQEANQFYQETLKILPPEIAINILDLAFKYSDAPGAQAMSSRLKKMVDPKLLDESERDDEQDPQVVALTQQLQQVMQAASQQVSELQAELQSKQADTQLKSGELELQKQELDVKGLEAQAKLATAQRPDTPVDNTVALQDLQLKEFEAKSKDKNETLQRLIEIERLKLEALKLQPVPESNQPTDQPVVPDPMKEQQDAERTQALAGIMQSIDQLTQAVMQPIKVERDEAGNLTVV